MTRIIRIALIILCCAIDAGAQNTTNSGTEFWTAYMDHNNGASKDGNGKDGGSLMSLYITSAVNTSGSVTIADASFDPIHFTVTANQVTIVTIPPSAFLPYIGVASKGIHITALKPVAIYAHIYALAVSGATLLLPVSTLGKDYISINYTQNSNAKDNAPAYSTFIVIATEDNTTVQITPSATLLDGNSTGSTFAVKLNKGQLYQGLATSDLTGTKVTAINSKTGGCTKVAFFSGSSRIEIGCNSHFITSDNLFQQVYPTASWGKSYITVPLQSRDYDVFRIILSNPAVDPAVKINGAPISANKFSAGYYEFPSQKPNVITASQPIQVAQYAVSEDNTIKCDTSLYDLGDPEMIYLNPLEQTVNHVTLYSTGNYQIVDSYINVVIKTSAVPTFTLDGTHFTGFSPVPNDPLYSYAQIGVQSGPQDIQTTAGGQGTHTISAGDGFNAIAYGFGQAESYGYAAGTNLQNLNEHISLANPANDTITQANGCLGVNYKLQLTLPYQTTNIVWDFKNGTTYTDNNPKVVATVTKGTQVLYLYQYYKPIAYSKAGDTSVVATVFNPIGSSCGSNDVVEFDFNISASPIADFVINDSCLGDSTVFIDKTNINGSFIKNWLWDFGDKTTSVLQNPKHLYANPGSYTVTLTVSNLNGCGTSTSQQAYINHKPVAVYTTSAPNCAGQAITFTDKSTSVDGKIVQWRWSYGDGKSDIVANNNPMSHTYTDAGTDSVKLVVVTDNGCSSLASLHVITINPAPIVDFGLPDVCLSDTYAQFTDKSTVANNSEGASTYLWNFGDPNATPTNPNTSTERNPRHKYFQANNYNVSLTVTSQYGCALSKTQPFTVNGDIPLAGFVVENSANLCSASDVIFDDRSTVNFGSITKIIWYFDYNNHPTDTAAFTKENIPADRKFHYSYGLFNSPATKSYTVRMDVFSGITCVNSVQQNITVYVNPVVALIPIGPVCQNAPPVQIAVNNNGFNGTGIFSGAGVSPAGLFNPAVTGPGKFTVNYKFTAQNGCDYSTSEDVVVNTTPTITISPEITMLQGGQITIPATATGDNLSYKWTPATGLDHDNILNPVASPQDNITYKLLVTNAEGCSTSAEVNVNVLKYPIVPNAFTPNGDGINDTWNIKYLNSYPNNTVDIFNRYGEKVYSATGYATPWDGTYKGANLPAGTYYYVINPKNGRKVISGSVTIIR